MLDNPDQPQWRNRFFIGVPAPAGALVVLLPVYFLLLGVENTPGFAWSSALFMGLCGFLMVSNIATYSGKDMTADVRRDFVLPMMVCAVFLAALLFSYPWWVLSTIAVGYLTTIPFSYRSWHGHLASEDN